MPLLRKTVRLSDGVRSLVLEARWQRSLRPPYEATRNIVASIREEVVALRHDGDGRTSRVTERLSNIGLSEEDLAALIGTLTELKRAVDEAQASMRAAEQVQSATELIEFCQSQRRICPNRWYEFYQLLVQARPDAEADLPGPLILAGAAFSSDEDKRERLARQIKWAEHNGCLEIAKRFLTNLRLEEWLRAR
jgi:hypothetical protein